MFKNKNSYNKIIMNNKKVLILSPTAGFGNRIRSICGALLLSYMSGRKLYVIWDKEDVKENDFDSISNVKKTGLTQYFKNIKDCEVLSDKLIPDVCYSEWLPGEFWYDKQSHGQKKLFPIKTLKYASTSDIISDKSNIILLETSYIIKPENTDEKVWKKILTSIYKNNFDVVEKYKELLGVKNYDVGISIRRGEFLKIYPEINQSVEDISSWITKSFKGLKVVIFSDDHEFRDKVRQVTGYIADPIINDVSWEKGFMEFLTLSTCTKVYGTKFSSFAEEAALFGDKQYDLILNLVSNNYDEQLINSDLYNIGVKSGTDKITHHGYHRFYDKFLKDYRNEDNMGMIEIGVGEYKSLHMWLNYFPKAFIYGVDLNKSSEGEKHLVYKADQNNTSELAKLKNIIDTSGRKILFICDDGSHFPIHIFTSFNYMFKNILKEGGVYIIEGIETSYWKRGQLYGNNFNYGYHHQQSVVETFKAIVDDINGEFLNNKEQEKQKFNAINQDVKLMISTVTFCHNCIIIIKKTNDEYLYSTRKYRFGPNVL